MVSQIILDIESLQHTVKLIQENNPPFREDFEEVLVHLENAKKQLEELQ